jgi:N12 class adenine-specific DNA methylase
MTTLQSIARNIEALNELNNSINEQCSPRQEVINKYVGFGNIKEILMDPYDNSIWDKKESLQQGILNIHVLVKAIVGEEAFENTLNHIQSSTLTSYYTDKSIVTAITETFSQLSLNTNTKFNVLDPSSGSGAFIRPMINDNAFDSITSFEKDILTALLQKNSIQSSKLQTYSAPLEHITQIPFTAKNTYNLILSNIPFGKYRVFDSEFNKMPNNSIEYKSLDTIHGYFFMKSISLLEKDGYLAFITSTGIADSNSNELLRREILKKCELVTALRLPNHVFDEAGTKVVSDLIILKKRAKTLASLNDLTSKEIKFISTSTIEFQGKNIIEQSINNYFLEDGKPNNKILGEFDSGYFFDKEIITIKSNNTIDQISDLIKEDLSATILANTVPTIEQPKQAAAKAPIDLFSPQLSLFDDIDTVITNQVYHPQKNNTVVPLQDIIIPYELIQIHNLREGNIYVHEEIVGTLEFTNIGAKLVPLRSTINKDKAILAFKILRDYKALTNLLIEDPSSEKRETLHQELSNNYNSYVIRFNNFHHRSNIDILHLDTEGFKLKGLEVQNTDLTIRKSDVLTGRIFEIISKEITLEDAVHASLNVHGKIDIPYIAQRTKFIDEEVIAQGIAEGLIFINPITNLNYDPKGSYVPLEEATYSFVAKDELISGPIRFKVEELKAHKDQLKILDEQNYNNTMLLLNNADIPYLSITEIDCKLGEAWIPKEHYNGFASELFNTHISIRKNESNSSYSLSSKGSSYEINNTYAVRCKNGRTFTGDDLLIFAMHGASPRITYTVDYGDGSKKTFLDREAMSSVQMKLQQINHQWSDYIHNNPAIGKELEHLYNNTQNLHVERIYDGSHLQFPGLQTFTPYAHQKNGTWQMLLQNGGLIDHEVGAGKTLLMACQTMEMKRLGVANKTIIVALKANTLDIYADFKKAYPESNVLYPTDADYTPAKRLQFFQKIQNNNWDAIIMTHDQFGQIPQSREIQLQILNDEIENLKLDLEEHENQTGAKRDRRTMKGLQVRIENKTASIQALSESLEKDPNLLTFDKMGIDHIIVDESQMFKNLEYTTRHSRVAGLGSPEGSARALNMLMAIRTIQDKHQADKGITFCSGTPISNSLIELYLLKKYLRPTELKDREMKNFDSWARTYAEISRDFEIGVTNEIKPKERFRTFQKVPELARWYRSFTNVANQDNLNIDKPSLNINLVDIKSTSYQAEISQQLIRAVQTDDFSYFGESFTKEQLSAKMLIATNISSKIAMDVRLIDSNAVKEDGSKLNEVAANINRLYLHSDEVKGTQLVFCDTATPKGKSIDEHRFNLYTELKRILVNDYNIPEKEIEFIHYHDTKPAKKALFKKVNDGEVRIVLGSTEKMGVGVNMQQRVIAMHHLDIPWRPSDISQRNGRGERQGNIIAKSHYNNKVENYIYATTNTLDAYKYFIVDLKQKFINQIKQSNITQRTFDEGELDDGAMSPAAFIAQLSGKKELLDKIKIDKQIQELELKRTVLKQEYFSIQNQIKSAEKNIPTIKQKTHTFKEDIEYRKTSFQTEKELSYIIQTKNGTITKKEDVSRYLLSTLTSNMDHKSIGKIGEFQLMHNPYIDVFSKKRINQVYLKSEKTDNEYVYGNGNLSLDIAGNIYRYPYDCVKGLETQIEKQDSFLNNLEIETDKNKVRITQIDSTIYDKDIEQLYEKLHLLELIIEQGNNDANKELSYKETLENFVNTNNMQRIKPFYDQLNIDDKPIFITVIENDASLTPIQKKEYIELIQPKVNNISM